MDEEQLEEEMCREKNVFSVYVGVFFFFVGGFFFKVGICVRRPRPA